ncbi:MAG: hypothetical protein H7645_06305 [Candidatus Heimdallarchaeota archaeon]|nr:hypothetical protein [Candidatus Heimdallarchaeota archaeon]MCK4769935.1 hypothetical protein [Candidatus Heimdallarchaeota archaeon]
MNDKKADLSPESSMERKRISSNTKTFILGAIIWSSLFLVIPPFIYLGVKDWIVALSITGKVGIVFILLSFVLLGTVGTTRVSGHGVAMATVDYIGGYDEEGVPIKRVKGINYWEILSIGQVWLLLWGAIYLLPFAFGIPFIL